MSAPTDDTCRIIDRGGPRRKRRLRPCIAAPLGGVPAILVIRFSLVTFVITTTMADPSFYQQDKSVIQEQQDHLSKQQTNLEAAYARWEALEALQQDAAP